MKITEILLSAVISAVAMATASAQVYSTNAVAGIVLRLKPGFNLIQNPLDAGAVGGNVVSNVLAGVADGTTVYRYTNSPSGSGFIVNDYTTLFGWTDPNMSLAPGEGAFVDVPPGPDLTILFVGDVPRGHLVTSLPAGYSLVGSKVPQAGQVSTDLGLPAEDGDLCFQYYNAQPHSYFIINFSDLFGWDPPEPTLGVGEAFWYEAGIALVWVRDFEVIP